VAFISESEAVTAAGVFQRVRSVDEKYGMFYVVFLVEFFKEYPTSTEELRSAQSRTSSAPL
jgi:hypothetical protein